MFQTITIADILNKPTQDIPFTVARVEDMPDPEHITYPHKHNFYEIFWAIGGQSEQVIDYTTYKILPDTLFFISPGQLHLWETWDDVAGYCILFTEAFYQQAFSNKNLLFQLSYLDNLYQNPCLRISTDAAANLLHKEANSDTKDNETIQALLLVLLKGIQKLYTVTDLVTTDNHHLLVFKQFKKLVETQFNAPFSVKQYASQLHLSAHHLTRLVKTISGTTPGELIAHRRLLEARQLLHFTDLTSSQIADQIGFDDSSYFARYFRKQTGLSPLAFRRRMHEKYRKQLLQS